MEKELLETQKTKLEIRQLQAKGKIVELLNSELSLTIVMNGRTLKTIHQSMQRVETSCTHNRLSLL